MRSALEERGYTVRRLDHDNLADVEALHRAVYGRRPAPGFFARKYDTRFTGVQHVGFVAYAGRKPVAFYGVLPCYLEADGAAVLAAQSADTMTHPGHRNQGLFVALAERTFALCREHGIRLLFGFPNQNSLPGFLGRLEWRSPVTMDYFVVQAGEPARAARLADIPGLRRLVRRHRDLRLAKLAAPHGAIANSVLGDGYHGIRRDAAWFAYKRYGGTHIVELAGATIWLKPGNSLWVGDIDVAPGDFYKAIEALGRLACRLGMREIHFHACPGTTLHRLLAARVQPTPGFPVIFKVFDASVPVERIRFTGADIDIF